MTKSLPFSASEDYNVVLTKLKNEFEKEWTHNTPSSCDQLKEFNFLQVLGQGAFGVVKLVRRVDTNKFYAMKILTKSKIIQQKQVKHAKEEKKFLKTLNFPFLVHNKHGFAFKDNSFLYLSMPFINGGEMFTHLRKAEKFDENLSCFYGAQILLALEYLHFLNLIYRDLKPENILIDYKGFVRMTDFGCCKLVKERTYTFCGTSEYLAPEIIQAKGYSKAVDWWCFGILLFEMANGSTPFFNNDTNMMKLYEKIVSGKFKQPSHFSKDLKHLLRNLIEVNLTRRFGNLRHGVNDIKQHPWFNRINWIQLLNKEVKPPFTPSVSGEDDTSQFDSYQDIKMIPSKDCKFKEEFEDF